MRERSRAYPGESLSAAIEALRTIRVQLGTSWFARSDAAGALDVAEGTVVRVVAALAQYGLLEKRTGGEYRVSELGSQIIDPINEAEQQRLCHDAALNPTLFREVFESCSTDRQLPMQLRTILIRQHGIAPKAADSAAETLRDTFDFARIFARPAYATASPSEGVDSSSRVFSGDQPKAAGYNETDENARNWVTAPLENDASQRTRTLRDEIQDVSDNQVFLVALSGGRKARLELPSVLTERDLMILRRQLEVIELQISDA